MTVTDSRGTLHPDFSVTTPEDLEERYPGIPLYPGITAHPVRWTSPTDSADPAPREAYVRFEPGAAYPEPDVHADSAETVLVLLGLLQDEYGAYAPGTLVHGERGSAHTPRSDTGCLLYVRFPDR
jgi:anti-sigma factor ChrR (cupin superfamily)